MLNAVLYSCDLIKETAELSTRVKLGIYSIMQTWSWNSVVS